MNALESNWPDEVVAADSQQNWEVPRPMCNLIQELIRSVVKVIISFAAGGGVGLLAVGVLATMDPDRWDFHYIDRHGPPFGPTLLSVGAGLLTSAITMCALFFPSWWRTMKQTGQWVYADEPPQVTRQ